jgi:hypothetical protein
VIECAEIIYRCAGIWSCISFSARQLIEAQLNRAFMQLSSKTTPKTPNPSEAVRVGGKSLEGWQSGLIPLHYRWRRRGVSESLDRTIPDPGTLLPRSGPAVESETCCSVSKQANSKLLTRKADQLRARQWYSYTDFHMMFGPTTMSRLFLPTPVDASLFLIFVDSDRRDSCPKERFAPANKRCWSMIFLR